MSQPVDKPSQGLRMILLFEKYVPFISIILFIVLVCLSGAFLNKVYSRPEVFGPPYSPYIKPGTVTPLIIACIGVALFTLSLCMPHSTSWRLACIVARFSLAAGLVASAVLQSRYLPLPLGSCENYRVWRDPASISEGIPTIFEVLPITRGKKKSGGRFTIRPCDALVTIWRVEIALAVLTTVLGLCVCLLVAHEVISNNPATSPPAAAQWLTKPFKFGKDYVRRLWSKSGRDKERKEAEAKLLPTDPEALEYIDHEMAIRNRPI
ncbi:hypothetical protein BDV41DRAFT_589203 [Aspergillus transmontanensis]|uniref:Tetraspanin/Peripherin n=1 Tax=Aspergillus transmontanensis TaxID=1034304 RepID=A0A5N6VUZ0_9EURO|nr:hypothetical protein BDV41DRAFT_589203 [Aspergillus transmontanensis]